MRNNKLITCTNIKDMYGYCGYISPEGVFYKEKAVFDEEKIESELYAFSIINLIEENNPNKNFWQMLKMHLKDIFNKSSFILLKKYGFVRISDNFGIPEIEYQNYENLTDIQKQIINKLNNYYFSQKLKKEL